MQDVFQWLQQEVIQSPEEEQERLAEIQSESHSEIPPGFHQNIPLGISPRILEKIIQKFPYNHVLGISAGIALEIYLNVCSNIYILLVFHNTYSFRFRTFVKGFFKKKFLNFSKGYS